MLDQVIYTRCSPHRDLKNKGQVVRSDGFGVFSMSGALFSNQRIASFDFLQARLAVPNGAKEDDPVGLFHSYEYFMAAPGVFALSYEVARPHCKIPRANGKSHRKGTYIKQSLIGNLEGYPCEWFGASAWNAHLKSENDYYLDSNPNAAPPLLPQVASAPSGGYINAEQVRRFVSDGRANAVKACIWFLLQQFERPEGERKVLLIKDTPENVELWIAAIEYGFAPPMARKITFTTNRSKLGTQADIALFYYTDERGIFYPIMNRSVAQTRHPYCMIVGYHPKDTFCAALKQLPTSNFVILDGAAKTPGFQTDGTISRPYYSAVVQYDEDIQDFCKIVLPSLPSQELTGKLPDLFDAYKYLLDANHESDKWGYDDTVRYLSILLQYGMPNNAALNHYLTEACLSAYPRFASQDGAKGCPLLQFLWKLATAAGKGMDVTSCVAAILGDQLNHLAVRNNGISDTWKALKAAHAVAIVQPALRELLGDAELSNYAKQFKSADSQSVETVLELFFHMLSSEKLGIASIGENKEKYSFVYQGILALLNDPPRLTGVLKRINTVPDLFYRLVLTVAENLANNAPAKLAFWWDTVIQLCGGSTLELCRKLCASQSASIETVEQLLTNQIEYTRKYDPELGKAFAEAINALGKKPDTGRRLFSAWIQVSVPGGLETIIRTAQDFKLDPRVETELFQRIDAKLPYDTSSGVNPAVYRELQQWADSLHTVSRSASFYRFKRDFVWEQNTQKAIKMAQDFGALQFSLDESFLRSAYFAELVEHSSEFCSAGLHIALLCLFQGMDGAAIARYADEYAAKTVAFTRNRSMAPQLLSLCEATMVPFQVPGKTDPYVRALQGALNDALTRQLVDCYKPALLDQVARCVSWDPAVRERLMNMLQYTANAAPKGFGGFFNNLNPFRKR